MSTPCQSQANSATDNLLTSDGSHQTGAAVSRSDDQCVHFGACPGCPYEYGCDAYCPRRDGRRRRAGSNPAGRAKTAAFAAERTEFPRSFPGPYDSLCTETAQFEPSVWALAEAAHRLGLGRAA